tara:strand:+ start:2211 stop:3326 length:1116 start_codon:yes stop_codon:yes gene_type:complete
MKIKEIKGYKLFFTNNIKNKIYSDLKKIMNTGNLSMGIYVDRLENKFKQIHKSKYAVACNSGGGALEIIFKSLDLKGKDVLVPTNTFIATYNAVKFSGGIPKLVDTGPENLNITLETIKKKVTKKTKCIVIVHVGAIISNEIVKIAKFCKNKKIYLVEDCAHASLTKLGNKFAGNFGIAGAFSFYSTKSITSGEGGMVTTNNYQLYKKLKLHTSYGMTKKYNNFNYLLYGANFRMNEAEAIIGYHHLINYNSYLKEKIKIKKIYDQNLRNKINIVRSNSKGNLYKYICLLPKNKSKKNLIKYLNKNNIFLSGDVYNKPLHKYNLIRKEHSKINLPNSEDVCSRHICLPIYLGLKNQDAKFISNKIIQFLKK